MSANLNADLANMKALAFANVAIAVTAATLVLFVYGWVLWSLNAPWFVWTASASSLVLIWLSNLISKALT